MHVARKVVAIEERRNSVPQEIAATILAGFDKHYRLFREAAISNL